MSIFIFCIVGGIVGWLTEQFLQKGSGYGMIADIVIGVLGGLIGGWLLGEIMASMIVSAIGAIIGAFILIWIVRVIRTQTAGEAA